MNWQDIRRRFPAPTFEAASRATDDELSAARAEVERRVSGVDALRALRLAMFKVLLDATAYSAAAEAYLEAAKDDPAADERVARDSLRDLADVLTEDEALDLLVHIRLIDGFEELSRGRL